MTVLPFKQILLVLIVSIVLGLGYLIFLNLKERGGLTKKKEISFESDIRIDDFKFYQTEDSNLKLVLQAKQAKIYEDEHVAEIKDIKVTFNSPDSLIISLEGEEGKIDTLTKDFYIKNNNNDMIINLNSGYTISSRSIKWHAKEHIVDTEDAVHIKGNGFEIKGNGLLTNMDTKEVKIVNNVNFTTSK